MVVMKENMTNGSVYRLVECVVEGGDMQLRCLNFIAQLYVSLNLICIH